MVRCLLVDIGNQRLKWAAIDLPRDGGPISFSDLNKSVSKLKGYLSLTSTGNNIGSFDESSFSALRECEAAWQCGPDQVWVSIVSDDQVARAFNVFCEKHWELLPIHVASEASKLGLENLYNNPKQLGVDRWLAALAADQWAIDDDVQRPVVIVDAGTAVTVDVINNRQFFGGAIMPGFNFIVRTLGGNTGKISLDQNGLEDMAWDRGMDSIAKNSADAVTVGAMNAVIGGIDRYIGLLHKKLGSASRILVTGGDGQLVQRFSKHSMEWFNNLVLLGLAIVAVEANQ